MLNMAQSVLPNLNKDCRTTENLQSEVNETIMGQLRTFNPSIFNFKILNLAMRRRQVVMVLVND
jgi:hypothetical protein